MTQILKIYQMICGYYPTIEEQEVVTQTVNNLFIQYTEDHHESMLRKIVRKTGGSVLQIDLRADPPAFTGAKPIRPAYEGVPVPIVVITESGPGLLVLNPAAPQILKRADMPVGLLTTLDSVLATKKGVIGMEVKAPQQPPGKTLAELRAQASQRQPSVQPPPSQPADEQPPSQPPPRPDDLA